MITPIKANQLIDKFKNLDDAILYCDDLINKTGLSYWTEVKRRIVNERNRRKLVYKYNH